MLAMQAQINSEKATAITMKLPGGSVFVVPTTGGNPLSDGDILNRSPRSQDIFIFYYAGRQVFQTLIPITSYCSTPARLASAALQR
jgi:hypothetical protein